MTGFWYQDELGEEKFYIFSLCTNGRWIDKEEGLINFDYPSDEIYSLAIMNDDIPAEEWAMLLQVLNLETT